MKKHIRYGRHDKPGRYRFSQQNPRGKDADWVEFACTPSETDTIMEAIGAAIERHPENKSMPAGTLLAEICREWLKEKGQKERDDNGHERSDS